MSTQANNGKERKDLYSDNWDGDVYKGAWWRARQQARGARLKWRAAHALPCAGSGFNILNLLVLLFVLTPVLGLGFAFWSYGTLWG